MNYDIEFMRRMIEEQNARNEVVLNNFAELAKIVENQQKQIECLQQELQRMVSFIQNHYYR